MPSIPRTTNRYVLTAHLNGEWDSTSEIHDDDTDATFWALSHVMDTAVTSTLWAKGEIVLYNPAGKAIHTLDAKA